MQPQRYGSSVSVEDYLAGEQDGQVRHEYVAGQVYAMVGASDRHGLIAGNLFAAIHAGLPDRCQAFISDMKLHIQLGEKDIFYYPDILVSCDARDREAYFREQPCLVIEVLSPGTARLDRFEKLMFDRHIDSLQEYVLVSQDYRSVEIYRRGAPWEPTLFTAGEVAFESLNLSIAVDEIYRGTDR